MGKTKLTRKQIEILDELVYRSLVILKGGGSRVATRKKELEVVREKLGRMDNEALLKKL